LAFQHGTDRTGDLALIFDHEEAHAASFAARRDGTVV